MGWYYYVHCKLLKNRWYFDKMRTSRSGYFFRYTYPLVTHRTKWTMASIAMLVYWRLSPLVQDIPPVKPSPIWVHYCYAGYASIWDDAILDHQVVDYWNDLVLALPNYSSHQGLIAQTTDHRATKYRFVGKLSTPKNPQNGHFYGSNQHNR